MFDYHELSDLISRDQIIILFERIHQVRVALLQINEDVISTEYQSLKIALKELNSIIETRKED